MFDTTGIRAKRANLTQTLHLIEDLYTAMFAKVKKTSMNSVISQSSLVQNTRFPVFVHKVMKRKSGGKAHERKCIQACADLVSSVEYHKENSLEVDLFSKFLTMSYDTKDLVFFLYL